MIRGVHLGQVVDVHPKEYEVSVYLPYLPPSLLGKGLRVRLGGRMQQPRAGDYYLPRVGEWGLVAFPLEDPRSGVWLLSLPDRGHHLVPEEILTQDPKAALVHWPGGQWALQEGDGSTELAWPDGTFLQVLREREPGEPRPRKLTRRKGQPFTPPEREPLPPPQPPRVALLLRHASGTEVRVGRDGRVEVRTAQGRRFVLDDPGAEILLQDPGGSILRITPTGVTLHAVGSLTLTATGPVTIDGASIAIG